MFFGGIIGAGARRTFLQKETPINSAHSTATFTDVNIGPAADDRLVVMIMQSKSGAPSRSLSSVSIGGSAASLPVNFASTIPLASTLVTCIATRLVTSGTTATFSATFSGSMGQTMLHTYVLHGLQSTTPAFTASAASNAAVGSISSTINIPAGGLLLMVGGSRSSGLVLVGATEDDESTTGFEGMATGSLQDMDAETARAISIASGANMNAGIGAAAWV